MSVSALREELARVRQQGYAINDQELEIGLRSLAVPLTTPDGRIAAALNVGVHASRFPQSVCISTTCLYCARPRKRYRCCCTTNLELWVPAGVNAGFYRAR